MQVKETQPISAREAAYQSLLRYHTQKRYANLELDTSIRRYGLEGAERALYTTLVYGVIERTITLDYLLKPLCVRSYDSVAIEVQTILRLGAYQILFLDRLPDYAVVDSSVELCKKACKKAAGMVNAVLRNLIREGKKIVYPDPKNDFLHYLSVRYSCPRELCELWVSDYGKESAEAILQSLSNHPCLTLRTNTQKITRDALLERLCKDEIAAQATEHSPFGIRLLQPIPVGDWDLLQNGFCFVQDEASQLASQFLTARAGDCVLDACACPGGKSFSIAMQMQDQGTLYSCDLHENKLSLITSGAQKLGLTCIQTKCQNGAEFYPEWEEKMDCVLCDVPCSGLGVIAKKPDLRYKPLAEIERLPSVQSAILENCARYVKKDGVLVYSTCTLHRAENEMVVEQFLQKHPTFQMEQMQTFFPHITNTDGFFVCRLKKKTT